MSNTGDQRWRRIGLRIHPQWETATAELGLRYERSSVNRPPLIFGQQNGYDIEVTCTDDREGSPKPVTRYSVRYRTGVEPIRIGREQVFARLGIIGARFKAKDLEVGDGAFDKLALIDARTEACALQFLTERRRSAITDLLSMQELNEVFVTDSMTSFETKRQERSVERLIGNIIGLARFAQIMGSPMSGAEPLPFIGPGNSEAPLRSYFDADPVPAPISDAVV